MSDKVVALHNFAIASNEPVQAVIEILEDQLAAAKEGKIIGVAVVSIERDPLAFVFNYHADQSSCHNLAAGVCGLHYKMGKAMAQDAE